MEATQKTYLVIPPEQRKAAFRAAGKLANGENALELDKTQGLWFARPGADLEKLRDWLPDTTLSPLSDSDPLARFTDFLIENGAEIGPHDKVEMDGKTHRLAAIGDKAGKQSLTYVGHLDGFANGWVQNWLAGGERQTWKMTNHQPDPAALAHIKATTAQRQLERARETQLQHDNTARETVALLASLPQAQDDHPYLLRKGVPAAEGVRLDTQGRLVIPLSSADGSVRTRQTISADPGIPKKLAFGGEKAGACFVVGGKLSDGAPLLLAEGYATAASLAESLQHPVVMAIDSGNLPKVAEALHARYPNSPVVIFGDDDIPKPHRPGNPGKEKALEAARLTGGTVILPAFTPDERGQGLTDFNDLQAARGTEAVRLQASPALSAQPPENTPSMEKTAMPDTQTHSLPPDHESNDTPPEMAATTAQPDTSPPPVNPDSPSADKITTAAVAETSPPPLTTVDVISEASPETISPPVGEEPEDRPPLEAYADIVETLTSDNDTSPLADTGPEPENAGHPLPEGAAAPEPANPVQSAGVPDAPESPAAPLVDIPVVENAEPETPQPAPRSAGKTRNSKKKDESAPAEPPDNGQTATTSKTETTAQPEENSFIFGPRAPGDFSATPMPARIDIDALLQRVTWKEAGHTVQYHLDDTPAFIDHGNRMTMASPEASQSTEHVLAALLTAIRHYGGRLELTGSETFKQKVMELIVTYDLNVSMKNPIQQAQLDDTRSRLQAEKAANTAGDTIAASPLTPGDLKADHASPAQATSTTTTTAPESLSPEASVQETRAQKTTQKPEKLDFSKGVKGQILEHGRAPFEFDKSNTDSYFIRLKTRAGEKTVWGKELSSAVKESRASEGQVVTLQYMGKKPVTVQEPQRNDKGEITGYRPVETHRNHWQITPAVAANVRPPETPTTGEKLSAYDLNAFASLQQRMLRNLPLADTPAIPQTRNALLWLRADGRGTPEQGDPLTASRPEENKQQPAPVLSAWTEEGKLSLHLVKGHGPYLQGVALVKDQYYHVLASLPGKGQGPGVIINAVTQEGLKFIGYGSAINRADGKPVIRDTLAFRLVGEKEPRLAKLERPEQIPPQLHARLGFDERYRTDTDYPKSAPRAEHHHKAQPAGRPG